MGEYIYQALCHYFKALEKTGYYKQKDTLKLLVLLFTSDFVFSDYRGILSRADYKIIEKALNCLFGSSCLIPYPDYLKMGKLHLGEITEMAQRIKNIEDTEVVKVFKNGDEFDAEDNDVILEIETDEED